jgi:hypothetical protein
MSANITVAYFSSANVVPSALPQEPQKRAVGEFRYPHCKHAIPRRAPQLSQKLLPSGFSALQAWQRIRALNRAMLWLNASKISELRKKLLQKNIQRGVAP